MRVLNKDEREKQKIVEMWTYCFSDTAEFIEWNFRRNFEYSQTYVAERNGEIAANMQLIPYTAELLGEEMPSVYYSGVATMPQYRNMGCARELMCESLELLKKRGIPIAHLIPFKFSFYEKFGFKAVSQRCTLNIQLDEIPYSCDGDFKLYNSMDVISDEVIEEVNRIYCGMCGKINFYIKRSVDNYIKIAEDIILNSHGYLAVSEDCYMFYGIEGEKISVYELCYSSANGFREALGFLKRHNAQRKSAEIITSYTPIIKSELCDIKNMISINPLAMLRIIDVEYVLGIFAKKFNMDFTIKIKDNVIAENNACFKIQNGAVIRCDENADITLSVSDFAQILCGYVSFEDAYEVGAVEVRNQKTLKQLENVFKRCDNYVNLML